MEEQKKKKKIASKIVDVVLGALIVLILGLQIDMFITKNNNFGIPSLFGYSFMEVLTDSMEGENPDSFDAAYYEMEIAFQTEELYAEEETNEYGKHPGECGYGYRD